MSADPGAADVPSLGGRGYRRRKLASLAETVFRAGATAVSDIRESYAKRSRAREAADDDPTSGIPSIPGSFPDVEIAVQGDEQMILFPSYARRHAPRAMRAPAPGSTATHSSSGPPHGSLRDEDYWRDEWERDADRNAIVDVDVRGWIYSPHKGPLNRRNRILLGIARHLSGLPSPRHSAAHAATNRARSPSLSPSPGQSRAGSSAASSPAFVAGLDPDQERIEQEAAEIERRGRREKLVALEGGYSEIPGAISDPDAESIYHSRSRSRSPTRDLSLLGHRLSRPDSIESSSFSSSAPASPVLRPAMGVTATLPSPLLSSSASLVDVGWQHELSEAELVTANANLSARVAAFLATALANLPVSIFFYNEKESRSRTVTTNEAGHFTIRAALDFVPTHVRVLANDELSAVQEVRLIGQRGVSLISDIDDTIKHSNISAGAREIFRNTFVRELAELQIDGVREWYGAMAAAGVSLHYCSNSPWQLYPVLASYFTLAGMPAGSLHLKQYSGMLQGIFEPVAERKKGTLTRLMLDFPDRRFLLVGDSGEADLEVYTELAIAHPGRILAILIRDVTSRSEGGGTEYFDSSPVVGALERQQSREQASGGGGQQARMRKTTQAMTTPTGRQEPVMGLLIDFSDEPEPEPEPGPLPNEIKLDETTVDGYDMSGRSGYSAAPPLPPRWNAETVGRRPPHPLSQTQTQRNGDAGTTAPPVLPPRRGGGTPSRNIGSAPFPHVLSPLSRTQSAHSDVDFDARSRMSGPGTAASGGPGRPVPPTPPPAQQNRKLELWHRRLTHAQEVLDAHGVALYTWRHGNEVAHEALAFVQQVATSDRRGFE